MIIIHTFFFLSKLVKELQDLKRIPSPRNLDSFGEVRTSIDLQPLVLTLIAPSIRNPFLKLQAHIKSEIPSQICKLDQALLGLSTPSPVKKSKTANPRSANFKENCNRIQFSKLWISTETLSSNENSNRSMFSKL